MATRYEKFLRTVPPLSACTRRELRTLARLVDDISIPAKRRVRATEDALMLVTGGHAVVLQDGSVLAVTPLRLLVVGRRELVSLLHDAPVLAASLRASGASWPNRNHRGNDQFARAEPVDAISDALVAGS